MKNLPKINPAKAVKASLTYAFPSHDNKCTPGRNPNHWLLRWSVPTAMGSG